MTAKADFTAPEWETLAGLPWVAGILVVVASADVAGMRRELEAMEVSVEQTETAGAATDLIAELVDDMQRFEDSDLVPKENNNQSARNELLTHLRKGAQLIDERCTPDEAAGTKRWILSVARATAEASKEGGFLGVGGERVSAEEEAAINDIETALGI